jgi:hypothetical protein
VFYNKKNQEVGILTFLSKSLRDQFVNIYYTNIYHKYKNEFLNQAKGNTIPKSSKTFKN